LDSDNKTKEHCGKTGKQWAKDLHNKGLKADSFAFDYDKHAQPHQRCLSQRTWATDTDNNEIADQYGLGGEGSLVFGQ